MRRPGPLLVNLALALSMLAVMALAIEGLARWSEARRVRADKQASRQRPRIRLDPVLGWAKVPHSYRHIRRYEIDVEIRANSHGLRGPERGYETPAGVHRVLLLGDSFTEGYYANEEDAVAGVLERQLNAAGCGRFEVINGGTISYSTDQEYVFYTTEGRRYGPEWVVLLFYYNDLYFNLRPIGPHGEPKPSFVMEDGVLRQVSAGAPAAANSKRRRPRAERLPPWHGSIALRMLSNRTASANPTLHRWLGRIGLVEPVRHEPPREFLGFGPRPGSDAAWKVTEGLLRALDEAVEADGARLLVFYVPARFEVNDPAWELTRQRFGLGRRWDRDRVYQRLLETCAYADIGLIDPRTALRRAEAGRPPAYLTRDEHWAPKGHAVAGEVIARALASRTACPSGPAEP